MAAARSQSVSSRRKSSKSSSSVATSPGARCQLSSEKANNVSTPTPKLRAAAIERWTASAPARWPSRRARPCRLAQRPLPSMMMPTWRSWRSGFREELCSIKHLKKKFWRGLPFPRHPDERFHLIQISLERPPAGAREAKFRLGQAPVEIFHASDVLGVLELARVNAQVAIRGAQQVFQLVER